jgi:hypothetical protein
MLLVHTFLAQAVDNGGAQLRNLLRTLERPIGFFALGVILAISLAAASSRSFKWYVLGAMFFASTLSVGGLEWFHPVLMFPIEQMRQQGRGMTIGLLLALLLASVVAVRGWRTRLAASAAIAYFVFELAFCTRLAIGGQYERAIFGFLVFLMTFGVMVLGVGRWLQDVVDAHRLLRALACGAALLVGVTMVQLLRDPSQVVYSNRLWGTTANPQHLAVSLALFLGPLSYLVIQRTEEKAWRLFAGAVAGLLVVFLIWTGSRTGVLMALVQFLLLFRLRVGKVILFMTVGGIFLLLGLQLFSNALDSSASRLLSTENTRQEVWQRLQADFFRNPLLGVMGEELGGGESSYLSAASQLGLFGLVPLGIAVGLCAMELRRLSRLRRHLGDYVLLADMVTAGLVTLAVGAFFEGYLMATVSVAVFFVYVHLMLLAFLIDLGRGVQEWGTGDDVDTAENSWRDSELAYEAGH